MSMNVRLCVFTENGEKMRPGREKGGTGAHGCHKIAIFYFIHYLFILSTCAMLHAANVDHGTERLLLLSRRDEDLFFIRAFEIQRTTKYRISSSERERKLISISVQEERERVGKNAFIYMRMYVRRRKQ